MKTFLWTFVTVVLFSCLTIGCGEPSCPEGEQFCEGACTKVTDNGEHCGACGLSCSDGQFCAKGLCSFCPVTKPSLCGNVCVDLQSEFENCGECGQSCKKGEYCIGGECRCPSGTFACGTECVDLQADARHCGKCGSACSSKQSCYLGVCIERRCKEQNPPLTECGRSCVELRHSVRHCGKCDQACRIDQSCLSGKCVCGPGDKICDGKCIDTNTHWEHCGGCGKKCRHGQFCANGRCVPSCPKSTPGQCYGGCFDLRSTSKHCGRCGNTCSGLRTCQGGECRCPSGFVDCQGRCVNLDTEYLHCGKCGAACAKGELCSLGKCVKKCLPETPDVCGFGCFDLKTSLSHCGKCGQRCVGGKICSGGACSCPKGMTECDGLCVDVKANSRHCGTCGQKCKDKQVCDAGKCQDTCSKSSATLCRGGCVELQESPLNCGKCGVLCPEGELCCNGSCRAKCGAVSETLPEQSQESTQEASVEEVKAERSPELQPETVFEPKVEQPLELQPEPTLEPKVEPIPEVSSEEPVVEETPSESLLESAMDAGVEQNPEPTNPPEKLPCTSDPRVGKRCVASSTKGACQQGLWGCVNNVATCVPGKPGIEICDKKDNDCDGMTDEDQICCKALVNFGKVCTVQNPPLKGVCKDSFYTCENDKLVCKQIIKSRDEVCDKKDNDCDGSVDEGGICCFVDPNLGKSCKVTGGKGVCVDGIYRCENDEPKAKCIPLQKASKEICDKLDNDCDGQIDEDEICCIEDPQYKQNCIVSTLKGPCAKGQKLCRSGALKCVSLQPTGTKEICDGIDNDCDGQVDQGNLCGWVQLVQGNVTIGDMARDSLGNVYMVGRYLTKATIYGTSVTMTSPTLPNTPPANRWGYNHYIVKFDKKGKLLWHKTYKSSGGETNSVVVDAKNNVYIGGKVIGGVAFGTTTHVYMSKGNAMFIVRLDPSNGAVVWVKLPYVAAAVSGTTYALAVGPQGQLYAGGQFRGTLQDGILQIKTTGFPFWGWIAELNPNTGAFKWMRTVPCSGNCIVRQLQVDKSGNIFAIGHFSKDLQLATQPQKSLGREDAYIAKFTSTGKLLWSSSGGSVDSDTPMDLALDTAGNPYIVGGFGYAKAAVGSKATFGKLTLTSRGYSDVFVASLSSKNGAFLWVTSAGGTSGDYGQGIDVQKLSDGKDYVFISGYYEGKATFGKTTFISLGNEDIFIAKLDLTGKLIKVKRAGSRNEEKARRILVTPNEEIYCVGHHLGLPQFDVHSLPGGTRGNFLWRTSW